MERGPGKLRGMRYVRSPGLKAGGAPLPPTAELLPALPDLTPEQLPTTEPEPPPAAAGDATAAP